MTCIEHKIIQKNLDFLFAHADAVTSYQRSNATAGQIALIEIAPDSDVDACWVRAAGRPEQVLSVKNPIFGPIDSDFEVKHFYVPITTNTDASLTRTIVGDGNAPARLRLRVTYGAAPLLTPRNEQRSPRLFTKTGLAPGAGTSVWEWPCHGRKLQSITLSEVGSTDATVVIYGRVQEQTNVARQDTLVNSFTLSADTTQNYQVDRELVDWVALSITGNGSNVRAQVQQWDD